MRGAEGFPVAGCAGDQAEIQTDGAFDRFNYSADGGFAAGGQDLKSA
jgi:hypothetical protein